MYAFTLWNTGRAVESAITPRESVILVSAGGEAACGPPKESDYINGSIYD